MITLQGLTVRDDKNPYGDIAIKTTGLRPVRNCMKSCLSATMYPLRSTRVSEQLTK